jgi:calcineurin-like phosphoesterase
VTEGKAQLSAVVIDVQDKTGKAAKIDRILINDDHMFFE